MNDQRHKKAIEIQDSIRKILYNDWDPIGVCGSAPEDEYDKFIAPVYRILAGSRSEDDLINLLLKTEKETIGLSCDSPDQLRPVARKLLALDIEL